MVSSSNWASIASLVVVSWFPYTAAIAILVLLFSLIQRISITLFSIISITSTLCLVSFLIRKPTPSPFLCCLFFPIHLYPVIVTSLLPIRCVSVIAAIWAMWECSADVRLDILLVIPLVLTVRSFSFFSVSALLVLLPLLVVRLLGFWLVHCSSRNLTVLHGWVLPSLRFSIPLAGLLRFV